MESNPFDCRDCEQITATAASGYTAAAVRFCPVHRAEADANMAAARAANPEIAALHRMMGLVR